VSESPDPSDPALAASPPAPGSGVWFWRGAWAAYTSTQALVLLGTYVGFGGLLQDIGFPLGAGLFSTLIVWALPAQVLLIGGYAAGTAAPVIALAVGLSSVRFLPLVVSILPYLRGRNAGLGTQLLAAHFVAVSAWVEAMRHLPGLPVPARLPFFFGVGNAYVSISVISTFVGYTLAGTLPHSLAVGLLFLTPVSFLLQLTRNARDIVDRLALAFGLVLAPLFAEIGGRLDLLWTGLVAGGAAYLVHRWRRRLA
jgi:predicted branched-subunit amino acid permease